MLSHIIKCYQKKQISIPHIKYCSPNTNIINEYMMVCHFKTIMHSSPCTTIFQLHQCIKQHVPTPGLHPRNQPSLECPHKF